MTQLNPEVTAFLDALNHPFRNEIELLRNTILETNSGLQENIKWNSPNYSFKNEDRITMRVQPLKQVQLVFHCGAKKQEQPKEKLINTSSNLLLWKENDRAIASFKKPEEVAQNLSDLITIINDWIKASTK